MDTDWCLTCGRQTNKDNEAYCSKTCMALDRNSVAQSFPVHMKPYCPSFELPNVLPPRRTPRHRFQTRREARSRTTNGSSKGAALNKSRFRDEELQESRSRTLVASSQWTGRDRQGILVWAHTVSSGLDEECASPIIDTASMSDLDQILFRPPPFPLTVQNLAPPYVTILPRHALLNHTSSHYPSLPEDPTAPSTTQDDASLLTPATDSVITPSGFSRTYKPPLPSVPSPRVPRLAVIINTLCSWIASRSRIPRASPEGSPYHSPSADDCLGIHSDETASCYVSPYGDKSSPEAASSPPLPPDNPLRAAAYGGSDIYEYDAA